MGKKQKSIVYTDLGISVGMERGIKRANQENTEVEAYLKIEENNQNTAVKKMKI